MYIYVYIYVYLFKVHKLQIDKGKTNYKRNGSRKVGQAKRGKQVTNGVGKTCNKLPYQQATLPV